MRNALGFPIIDSAIFGLQEFETNADIDQVVVDYEKFGIDTSLNPPGQTYGNIPISNPSNKTLKEWTNELAREMVPHVDELEEFALWCASELEQVEPITPLYQSGWTRYSLLTGKTKQVAHPTESVFVLDLETFVQGSDYGHAIIATAISSKALYVWLHPAFVDSSLPYEPAYVPVGMDKLIIGHNVTGFDRGRCEGSAVFGRPTNAWLDTMSMHMVTSGLVSAQRFWFMEKNPRYVPAFASWGCMANLVDCYNYYCFGELDKSVKETRNIFVEATSMEEFIEQAPELLAYAISDPIITGKLFGALWPRYRESNPSWASVAGALIIGNSDLPVTPEWDQWRTNCDSLWQTELDSVDEELSKLAIQIWMDWRDDKLDWSICPWLSKLDWTADWGLKKNGEPKSVWYGTPLWIRKALTKLKLKPQDVLDEPRKLGLSQRSILTPYLLKITYLGQPVEYHRSLGWCYRVNDKLTKVPHPNGTDANCGSVFSQDFLPDFESGVLASDNPAAKLIIEKAIKTGYWTSARSRTHSRHIRYSEVEVDLTDEQVEEARQLGYLIE